MSRFSCPSWARTRTLLIQRGRRNRLNSSNLLPFTRVRVTRCWSLLALMLDFAVVCSHRCRSLPILSSAGRDWASSIRSNRARHITMAPRSRSVSSPRCAAVAALDRSDPQAYVGAAYKPMKAHPAKAGVAKPRVLAFPATPEFRTPRRTSRPPSCIRSARRLCFL